MFEFDCPHCKAKNHVEAWANTKFPLGNGVRHNALGIMTAWRSLQGPTGPVGSACLHCLKHIVCENCNCSAYHHYNLTSPKDCGYCKGCHGLTINKVRYDSNLIPVVSASNVKVP